MLTALFCFGNSTTVLDTKTAFPFIQIFADSVPNVAAATSMTAIVLILTWNASIGITTTASRMTWSFARDRGTPFSNFIGKVEPRTQVPRIAVGVVTMFSVLLSLIYVGSDTAFNDVISLTITGFYGSYFLPAALLLYYRIKGSITLTGTQATDLRHDLEASFRSGPSDGMTRDWTGKEGDVEKRNETTLAVAPNVDIQEGIAQAQLIWGPWRLPGILGIINNAYACCYMVFVIFWSFWPPATPITASTMNYSVLVTGGVIIFSIIWYWFRGRKEYKGPTIDDEVKAVMQFRSIAVT